MTTHIEMKAAGPLPASGSAGHPTPRLDGPLKVTGQAQYAGEISYPGLVHGAFLQSTVPRGRVLSVAVSAALATPGVIAVVTHEDLPEFARLPDYYPVFGRVWAAQSWLPMQGDEIFHNGQHVAVVVGDTFEAARGGALRVLVSYQEEPATTDFGQALQAANGEGELPESWEICRPGAVSPISEMSKITAPHETIGEGPDDQRGDVGAGFSRAAAVVDSTFRTPTHHHNAMELHVAVAAWNGDTLTLHSSTAAVSGTQNVVAQALRLPLANVRVVAPFVGGSFGCKGRVWPHEVLAAAVARKIGRPLKLTLTRPQTFTSTGHRAPTVQRVRLGASADGTLTAISVDSVQESWPFETFAEPTGAFSRVMYACPNHAFTHRVVKVHAPKANMMHSPGDLVGSFAFEVAMDELAAKLAMDPLVLRQKNHADVDPQTGAPYSSKLLKECYEAGAQRFGWGKRNHSPRSMRHPDGGLMGWGMASTSYSCAYRQPARANAKLRFDGSFSITVGASDQGAGTYTALALIAAQALAVPVGRIRVELGDTDFPHAPPQVAALIVESVGPAVLAACQALIDKLKGLATHTDSSPMKGMSPDSVDVKEGGLVAKASNTKLSWQEVLNLVKNDFVEIYDIEAVGDATPVPPDEQKASVYSFGAVFCEVHVDPDLGKVRVTRMTGVFACGRIINPLTARSQLIGGMTWAIGHALMEGTTMDVPTGRYVNSNLADYHVPSHADVPDMDVLLLNESDLASNPTGAKTLGEIGVVGSVGAIVNAVTHATGLTCRDLPLTPDKLLTRQSRR